MTDETFNPGDVVTLKSGGPALTVTRVEGADVEVVWYADAEEVFRKDTLPLIALTAIEIDDEVDEEEDEDEEEE